VVSHITGDSVKEEVKEKREWPPKSVVSTEKPPLVIPTSLRHVPSSKIFQPLSDPSPSTPIASVYNQVKQEEPLSQTKPDVPLTTTALHRQTAEAPNSFLENWRKDIPLVPAEMAPEPEPTSPELTLQVLTPSVPTPTAASMQKFGNSIPSRTPTAALKTSTKSASKATSAISKAPTRIIKSPAPKQSLSSTTQPLRPQHTGQSVASTTSTRKSTVKPTPVTPKTGPRSDASRAKTPTSARLKTPTTGLFAPTAASLARSRNAPLQVLTPTKKPTLSSSSMDRLSKPTAASLSKARPPAVAAPTSASRSTVAKTKTASTTPRDKTSIAQKPATETVASPDQNGSGVVPAALIEAEAPVPDTAEEVGLIDEGENADPTLVPSSPAALKEETVVEEIHEDSTSGVSDFEPVGNHLEHKPTDDLEDIVNLLESAPLTKSESAIIPDIPDDILEIPDEEDKMTK
jgi:hypothetical protein